jgi:sulfur-oxidizing protein SoxZ
MENGRKKDKLGNLIPAHYIKELWIEHNNVKIITCNMGGGISKNPYFDFLLNAGEVDDKITVSWIDSAGKMDHKEHVIK